MTTFIANRAENVNGGEIHSIPTDGNIDIA